MSLSNKSLDESRRLGKTTYRRDKRCPHGHEPIYEVKHRSCVECRRVAARKYIAKNRHKIKEYNTNKRKHNPRQWIATNIRGRAKKEGIPFELTKDDIIIPSHCPCCGRAIQLRLNARHPHYGSPSVDRFDSNLGYIRNNIQVICWRCNTIKSNSTIEELRTIANWMEKVKGMTSDT